TLNGSAHDPGFPRPVSFLEKRRSSIISRRQGTNPSRKDNAAHASLSQINLSKNHLPEQATP
ncbi:hypothetical protein, partial [Methylobacterium isbiliense]